MSDKTPPLETLTPMGMANELGGIVIPVMLQSIHQKIQTGVDFQLNDKTEKELDEQLRRILRKKEWDAVDIRRLAAYFCTLDYLTTFHE